jgi:hypothetical protein
LDESRTDDIPQVSEVENGLLTPPYTDDEVRKAAFLMEHNKDPGPDGFPTEFYQYFWDVIKSDLLFLFGDHHTRQLEFFRLNFGEIILLSKINKAETIQQYRPIYFLNVSFNFLLKLLRLG